MSDEPGQFTRVVRDDLRLSAIHERDKTAFVAALNDKEIYDHTLRIPYPYTEADAEAFIDRANAATAHRGHPVHFAIRNVQDQLIGVCGFDDLSYGHRAEIGYWLARPHWGRGVMTDVIRSVCALAFEQWALVRITAHVFDFNLRSARVLEKNNFVCEGRLKKCCHKDGRFIDAKLYALVR